MRVTLMLGADHLLRLYNRHRTRASGGDRTLALDAARRLATLLGTPVATDDEADEFALSWLYRTSPGLARGVA